MKDTKISELTVGQLQRLIKRTVQQAVAEVMIEVMTISKIEDETQYEAEITEYVRRSLNNRPVANIGTNRRDD